MEKLIVFIIILIFSGIGKLIQKHNEQKQLESLRRMQQEQGQQRGQTELDAFLRGSKPQPQRQQDFEVEVLNDSDFEPVPAPVPPSRREPVRQTPAQVAPVRPGNQSQGNRAQQGNNRGQQGNQKSQQQQKKQKKQKSNQQNRGGQSQTQPQSQQSAQRRPLGEGVRHHVDQHIRHLDTEVDDHVKADIVDSVNSHLGQFSGDDGSGRVGNPTAARIVASLRSPEGVRQAMLINEILSRPRVLRK